MFARKNLLFQTLILGGVVLVSHNWASEPQGSGFDFDWKAAYPPIPPRHVIAGSVERLMKPANGKFMVHCYSPSARTGTVNRNLKVDQASLILRQGQDGRFSRVELADLYQDDVRANFVASVAPLPDPKNDAQLVYWLIEMPRGAGYPVPEGLIVESTRFPHAYPTPFPPIPTRQVVAGSVLGKPSDHGFVLDCSTPGRPGPGGVSRRLRVDDATLILRRERDGRFARVELAALDRSNILDRVAASIASEHGFQKHGQYVYWLIDQPVNVRLPFPEEWIEEPGRHASPPPSLPTNPARPLPPQP